MNINVTQIKTFTVFGVRRDGGVVPLPAGYPVDVSAPRAAACTINATTFKGSLTAPPDTGNDTVTASTTNAGVTAFAQPVSYVLDPSAIVGLTIRWD